MAEHGLESVEMCFRNTKSHRMPSEGGTKIDLMVIKCMFVLKI